MDKAEQIGIRIAKRIFSECCQHIDYGHCDRCIGDYLPKWIAAALRSFRDDGIEEAAVKAEDLICIDDGDDHCTDIPDSIRYLKSGGKA